MRYVSTWVEEVLRDGKMAFVAGPRQVESPKSDNFFMMFSFLP